MADTYTIQPMNMDYIEQGEDYEGIEEMFQQALSDNLNDWALLDYGTMDTVIMCRHCESIHICSDRDSAIYQMSIGCDDCRRAKRGLRATSADSVGTDERDNATGGLAPWLCTARSTRQ